MVKPTDWDRAWTAVRATEACPWADAMEAAHLARMEQMAPLALRVEQELKAFVEELEEGAESGAADCVLSPALV